MIDDKSDPGAWARELTARGNHGPRVRDTYTCGKCKWTGSNPSITDASSTVERNGHVEIDRTHLVVCPKCFELISGAVAQDSSPAPACRRCNDTGTVTYEYCGARHAVSCGCAAGRRPRPSSGFELVDVILWESNDTGVRVAIDARLTPSSDKGRIISRFNNVPFKVKP